MSVSIVWRPASDTGKSVGSGTSSSLMAFKEVFPGGEVGMHDIATLRAMAVAAKDSFFSDVADIVEQVGAIKIWGEY